MNNFELGKWNVICDRCHKKLKNDQVKKEWTGFMVCDRCWEPRHPQDLIKARGESGPLPFTRADQPDQFIDVDYVDTSVGNQTTTIPTGTFNMSLS